LDQPPQRLAERVVGADHHRHRRHHVLHLDVRPQLIAVVDAVEQVALGEDPDQRTLLLDQDRAAALGAHLADDLPHRVADVDLGVGPRRQLADGFVGELLHPAAHEPPPRSIIEITFEVSPPGGVGRGVASMSSKISPRCRITSHTVSAPSTSPLSSTIGTLRNPSIAIQLIANATGSRGRSVRGVSVMTSPSSTFAGSARSAAIRFKKSRLVKIPASLFSRITSTQSCTSRLIASNARETGSDTSSLGTAYVHPISRIVFSSRRMRPPTAR